MGWDSLDLKLMNLPAKVTISIGNSCLTTMIASLGLAIPGHVMADQSWIFSSIADSFHATLEPRFAASHLYLIRIKSI